jgi:hypothetical protein
MGMLLVTAIYESGFYIQQATGGPQKGDRSLFYEKRAMND